MIAARQRRRFGFPKSARLRLRPEFLRVQDRGQKLNADCILALVLPNHRSDGSTRLGLTVSSKVGNSVVRNGVRRRLRELFRKRQREFPRGLDMVLIARGSAAHADWAAFVRAFERLTTELQRKVPV